MRSISPALVIIINYFYCPQKYAKHLKEPFNQFNAFLGVQQPEIFFTDIFLIMSIILQGVLQAITYQLLLSHHA